ncbi:MAG: glycosyltransferase [Actinobacteria bacterium]|nr:glycosyltransferase [Actinomycetota bacterium]
MAFAPGIQRALRREQGFDLVRIHSLFLFPQYAAWRYCRRTSTPYIVSIHGALDPYLRERGRFRKQLTAWAWQNEMLRCASGVHVATEAEGVTVSEILPDLPLVTVPNGLDTRHFEGAHGGREFRRRFLAGHEGPVVLYLGRINFKKGLDTLLESFAVAVREVTDARLLIVGPDDEGLQPALEMQARRLGVSDGVTFIGPLHGPDRLSALAAAAAWVLPSHTENFGSAVIEAMAAGVPVIVSPEVNLAADIETAEAGLVAPRTPTAFANETVRLLRDSGLQSQLAYRGRRFARRYDWSTVGPQLADAYREAVARGSHYSSDGRRLRRRNMSA